MSLRKNCIIFEKKQEKSTDLNQELSFSQTIFKPKNHKQKKRQNLKRESENQKTVKKTETIQNDNVQKRY